MNGRDSSVSLYIEIEILMFAVDTVPTVASPITLDRTGYQFST